jgi:hypothetical protein
LKVNVITPEMTEESAAGGKFPPTALMPGKNDENSILEKRTGG